MLKTSRKQFAEELILVFLKFLLKINVIIGRKLTYLIAKYEAQAEIEEVIKTGKFDLRNIKSRFVLHDEDVIQERRDYCFNCEHFFKPTKSCKKCGCFVLAKIKFKNQKCPVGKWDRYVYTS